MPLHSSQSRILYTLSFPTINVSISAVQIHEVFKSHIKSWCSLIFALDSEFLWVFTPPVAVQLTDDIMLMSGGNSRQTTYTTTNRIDDWRANDRKLLWYMMALKNLAKAELLTQVKAHSFSIYLIYVVSVLNGHLLYQILFKCDLPGEGSPDMDCRCCWLTFQKLERRSSFLTLKITSAQIVETSVNNKNNKSPSRDYFHLKHLT